jgi:hypothetical protein
VGDAEDTVKRPMRWELAALLLLAGFICLCGLRIYDRPLERDLTTYAVIAHDMLAGRPLYGELWENKPPALDVSYAVAEWLCGYGPWAIYCLAMVAALATLPGVYAAGRAYPNGGLWAALFWAALSADRVLQLNQPTAEVFVSACLSAAFALLVGTGGTPLRMQSALVVGVLLGVASLYKQVAVAPAGLLVLAHVFFAPAGSLGRRRALIQAIAMGGMAVAVWGVLCVHFVLVGHFDAFYADVITYNRHFADNPLRNVIRGIALAGPGLVWERAPAVVLLAILGPVLALCRRGPLHLWGLLAAYTAGAMVAIHLPGKGHPQYYQVLLPPLAIGAGWTLVELRAWFTTKWSRRIALVPGLLALIQLGWFGLPEYGISRDEWSNRQWGSDFVETERFARTLDRLLLPNESFYVWGAESGLYFSTQRRPPVGICYYFPLLDGPEAEALSRRVLGELQKAPPDAVVYCEAIGLPSLTRFPPDGPTLATPEETQERERGNCVYQWWMAHYRPVMLAEPSDTFLLLVRRGSALDERLARQER